MDRRDETAEASREDVLSFFRSPVGAELFHRIVYYCLNCETSSDCALTVEESGLLRLAVTREFVSKVAPLLVASRYGCTGGIVSATLEREQSLLTMAPLEDGCVVILSLRRVLVLVEQLFLSYENDGMSYRRLKRSSEVDWSAALVMITDERIDFSGVFRHPQLMTFIGGIRSSGRRIRGTIQTNIGTNFLHFLLLFCYPSGETDAMLNVIMAFDERDSRSLSPLTQSRLPLLGSPANFYRGRYDGALTSNSDGFAEQSRTFRYLRDRFRSGPSFVASVYDDYGQTRYYGRTTGR